MIKHVIALVLILSSISLFAQARETGTGGSYSTNSGASASDSQTIQMNTGSFNTRSDNDKVSTNANANTNAQANANRQYSLKKLDTDNNGRVSKEEFDADLSANTSAQSDRFAKADKNKDGFLSNTELNNLNTAAGIKIDTGVGVKLNQ
jgi:hypothetical protein